MHLEMLNQHLWPKIKPHIMSFVLFQVTATELSLENFNATHETYRQ